MANTQKGSLFSRLTKLFRSGPVVRRRVRDFRQQGGSTALDVFRKAHSDVYNSTLSAYGAFDRMSRYSDFSEMEATPEICSSLDIYAEESVSSDDKGKVLHIYSENKRIQDILEELFYDILNVDFNLPMWARNLVKYGDFFIFNDISPEYGVINAYPIPISEIEREEGFDPNDPAAVRFRWITQGNQTLENWQVTHFRLLGNDAFLPYGSSVLESARRIWRQLIMMEDAMLVYRVIRAPERRVFYIDVGNTPPENIGEYMEAAQTSLKRNQVIDKITGKVDLRFNPLSVDEDYFMPVRGGVTGTKIDTLAGGQNTAAIEDVQYIQKKLFAALKIPKAYLGYDEDVGSKATLAQEDIRFSRAINRIQKTIISSLNQLAQIHLFCHGFEGEDLQDFSLFLTNPSSVAQEQKLNLIKTKFEIAGAAPEGVVDRRWIRKNVMGLTNDDIDLIKSGRFEDKEEDSKLEAAGQDASGGGGGGGSPLGGGGGGGFDMGSDLGGEDTLDDEAGDTGEDVGSEDAEGEDTPEDLFAGDKKPGDLLIASKNKKKKQEKNKKEDLEELDLSIDDEEAPEKAEKKMLNVFGGPITANRKVRNGRNDLQSPNFTSMVSIGSNTRSQDTSNKPFDNDFFSFNEERTYGESYVQPKVSRELQNMISSLGKSINRNKKSLISEDFDKDFQ
jgi:hypothetical protein